jgi:hypothetical protein
LNRGFQIRFFVAGWCNDDVSSGHGVRLHLRDRNL